ncbi:MAG: dihydropteroate synthase [Helicobacteraceae bacterium]|jgi:dihydropteroate synthase|nr:dihydropteroate synthase [Helicobacteraceae bacterium]
MTRKLPYDIDIAPILEAIGCDKAGAALMRDKARIDRYLLKNLSCGAANILKQDALSIGAELAVHRDTPSCGVTQTDALLLATPAQLKRLIEKEKTQPFGLKKIADRLQSFLKANKQKTRVMGVININDDSFNPASRTKAADVRAKAEKMIQDGAAYIDIGAVSSRPGSDGVDPQEELKRLKPAIDALYAAQIHEKAILSLDSYEPLPLKYALDRGFRLINDITGGADDRVLKLAAEYDAELCVMHMKGDPKTMQNDARYDDVIEAIDDFFSARAEAARSAGAKRLILDVGIGFGKTAGDNFKLIAAQSHFLRFGYDLLVGASRKSLIDAISPAAVGDRLGGTIALHLKAAEYGAAIIRCHDVFEHVQALRVLDALSDAALAN